jgi:hypothetical protein
VKFHIEKKNFEFEPQFDSTLLMFDSFEKDELRIRALSKPTSTETRDSDGTVSHVSKKKAKISVKILKHEHGVAILYKSESTMLY